MYDASIQLMGKTALVANYNKSRFCKKTTVQSAFKELITCIQCRHLILSYNNEGIMNFAELQDILEQKGAVKIYKIPYKKFKAQQQLTEDIAVVFEYIWVVDTMAQFETVEINLTI